MPELQAAFDDWIERGEQELPTVQQSIDNKEVDIALLHHLAKFIWLRAGGYVSSEATEDMMKEWRNRVCSTPESALAFLEKIGALVKVDK